MQEIFAAAVSETQRTYAGAGVTSTHLRTCTSQPGQQPTEEELRAALEEQMRQIRVEDVILQTTATLINLAGRRLGLAGEPEEKDIEQARAGHRRRPCSGAYGPARAGGARSSRP